MKVAHDYIGNCVVFACTDGKGNYLLQKRSQNCRNQKGKWDVGGGQIDFGEKAVDCLKREVKEEYGVDVIEYEFVQYRDALHEDGAHWLALDFIVKIDREKVKIGEPDKVDEIGWFTIDNLPEPVHSQLPDLIEALQKR